MAIKVQIPAPMRQHTDGKTLVEATGATVAAVLENVGAQYPALTGRLFDNGQVRRFVNLYLNNEDIRYLDNLATPVKDGDELAIIPAVAGGSSEG
jgi:molybdopterin converting factor small subunit